MSLRIFTYCFSVLGISAALASPVAVGAPERAFVVGFENLQYAPLFGHRNGVMTGFMGALLADFEREARVQFEYEPLPINRLYRLLFDEARIGFKFPDNPTWVVNSATDPVISYSRPVIAYANVLLSRRGEDVDLAKVNMLGSIRGITPAELLSSNLLLVEQVLYFNGPDDMLRALVQGRIDAAYVEQTVARQVSLQLRIEEKIQFNCSAPIVSGHYHLSTIKHPEILQKFDAFLVSNGARVDELKKQHGLHASNSLPCSAALMD
ncbi:substrate-binding periplasmic protein [Simiduia aestuariiviva]|uniref:ABC-type amino acid transport substrate-binding protein n=1 Tax=Simiduia aestuariiviva TaxID=1510459 RepID=A0A839UNZ0_9GAMM|nr:transporter substrate-binding domain-containing protein [Simiduia aestuariiviva]MBB3167157.1 ABC-type amino acid transport substrate-binding protein [Simiduia aestuariiviva]